MDKDTFNDLRKQLHCLDEGSSNTGVMDCNQDLVLLPLRYAVVGMDDNEPDAALPSLPPTLGLDLPQLQRALRSADAARGIHVCIPEAAGGRQLGGRGHAGRQPGAYQRLRS